MEYTNLDDLFSDWENTDDWKIFSDNQEQCFVRDGIVCEEEWKKQQVKILFVLKETNGVNELFKDDAKYDLRKFLRKSQDKKRQIWTNACCWVDYLLNCQKESTAKNDAKTRKDLIEKVAVMNVKKTPGKSKETLKKTCDFLDNNFEFILKEIQLINPDIIVCGTKRKCLERFLGKCDKEWKPNINNDKLHFGIVENGNKKILVFNSYHPASFSNYKTKIEDFESVIKEHQDQEIMKKCFSEEFF